jgi:hypothetical protein
MTFAKNTTVRRDPFAQKISLSTYAPARAFDFHIHKAGGGLAADTADISTGTIAVGEPGFTECSCRQPNNPHRNLGCGLYEQF